MCFEYVFWMEIFIFPKVQYRWHLISMERWHILGNPQRTKCGRIQNCLFPCDGQHIWIWGFHTYTKKSNGIQTVISWHRLSSKFFCQPIDYNQNNNFFLKLLIVWNDLMLQEIFYKHFFLENIHVNNNNNKKTPFIVSGTAKWTRSIGYGE